MTELDYILLTPIVIGLIRGLFRGFVKEIVGIIALVVAIIVTKCFTNSVVVWALHYVDWPAQLLKVIIYILLFLSVATIVRWLGKMLSRFLHSLSLGWLNHLLGGAFGALSWAIIVSLLLNLAVVANSYIHVLKPEATEGSILYQPMLDIAGITWEKAASSITL